MERCVIFDMDGVIIDSEPLHVICERLMFEQFHLNITEDLHQSFAGVNDAAMWRMLHNQYGLPLSVDELILLKREIYMKRLQESAGTMAVSGAVELVAKLSALGFKLALASSSPAAQIDFILNEFNLAHFFQSRISGDDVANSKPSPDIFLKAAFSLGIDVKDCVVIEDSANGVLAAKAAGMKCIGFRNPNSGKQDLQPADVVVDSFNDSLVSIITNLFNGSK